MRPSGNSIGKYWEINKALLGSKECVERAKLKWLDNATARRNIAHRCIMLEERGVGGVVNLTLCVCNLKTSHTECSLFFRDTDKSVSI